MFEIEVKMFNIIPKINDNRRKRTGHCHGHDSRGGGLI